MASALKVSLSFLAHCRARLAAGRLALAALADLATVAAACVRVRALMCVLVRANVRRHFAATLRVIRWWFSPGINYDVCHAPLCSVTIAFHYVIFGVAKCVVCAVCWAKVAAVAACARSGHIARACIAPF